MGRALHPAANSAITEYSMRRFIVLTFSEGELLYDWCYSPRSARVAARAQAARVGRTVAIVGLPVLVDAVEGTAARPEDAADHGPLAGARAAVYDRAAGGTDSGPHDGADRAVLHELGGVAL